MPDATTCLTALVGLSQSGSPCFPLPELPQSGGFPYTFDFGFSQGRGNLSDITASQTGYFVDQLIEFRIASGNGARDLYDRLYKARALAAQNLRAKLRTGGMGSTKYIQKGRLGGYQSNGMAGVTGVLSFPTAYHEAGALRITSIRLDTTATDADVVLLLDGEAVAVLASTNAAPQTVDLLIPLDGDTHTLEAMLGTGIRPLVNKLFCPGCAAGSPWAGAVARNLPTVTNTNSGQGFTLQVEEVCVAEVADVVCYAAQDEELAGMLGQALVYGAAAELVLSLLTDATINRYTLLEPKLLPAMGAKFQAEADAAIKWLNSPEGLARLQHPCYLCKPGVMDSKKVNIA